MRTVYARRVGLYHYKRQKPKVYNDVWGRLYAYHTTKTAKIKKEGDITLQHRQNVNV